MPARLSDPRARGQNNAVGLRLVQAACNDSSLSLYTKLGLATREPLSLLQGNPPAELHGGQSAWPFSSSSHERDLAMELTGQAALGNSVSQKPGAVHAEPVLIIKTLPGDLLVGVSCPFCRGDWQK
jgi:hypothetical protein